jgi:hypothetical protein
MGVQVLPATGRWDDFASFMVPRNPGGAGCVCMAYRNSSLDMPGRIAHMRTLCGSEPGPGVLAYVDGKTAPGGERVGQSSGYVGTVPLFEAHGFSRVCQTAGRSGVGGRRE